MKKLLLCVFTFLLLSNSYSENIVNSIVEKISKIKSVSQIIEYDMVGIPVKEARKIQYREGWIILTSYEDDNTLKKEIIFNINDIDINKTSVIERKDISKTIALYLLYINTKDSNKTIIETDSSKSEKQSQIVLWFVSQDDVYNFKYLLKKLQDQNIEYVNYNEEINNKQNAIGEIYWNMNQNEVKKLATGIIMIDYDTIKVYKDEAYGELVKVAYLFKYGRLQSYSIVFDTDNLEYLNILNMYNSIKLQVESEYNIIMKESYIWKNESNKEYERSIIDGLLKIESIYELESSKITLRIHSNNSKIILVLLNESKIGR